MNKYLLWSMCLLTSAAVTMLGQNSAGVGSIGGVVQDATGSVIPDAKVLVENPSKGIRREMSTTPGGVFNAPALVPAEGYHVTITKDGFATYEVKDIQLQVGETVNLSPKLQVSSASARVEVTSEAPIVESTQTEVSQVIGSTQLLDLPINGRRVDNFVLLTPGVTIDGAFGLLSFRGIPGGNSFLTDGTDTTNSFYDENAGRTRTYNISQDSVQEFQVITSNFLAEYGRASGGVVNTITRSGTNDFHGTGYWFFRNRTLDATDITTNGINPQDWRHQAGASVGGPIKKDKLFFFFNGELQRRDNPIVSSNTTNSNLFSSPTTFQPTACGSPATPGQCQAAESYILSRAAFQLVPRTSDVNLMFGKVDYQLNAANRLTFEFNYLDFRSPNGIQTQLSLTNGNAIGNNGNTTVFDRTGKMGWTTIVSPSAVNEARFGFFKDRQYDPASPSLLPPFGPLGLSIGGAGNISNIGYATSYPRLLPSEQRFQVADTLSYTTGRHSLKFGFDYSNTEDYVNQLSNQYGTYSYPSLTAFAQDFTANTGGKHWSSFSQRFGNPVVDTYLGEVSGFIQDEWHLTPKLTLSPGIRYEHTLIPQPKLSNPAFSQTGYIPNTNLDFAPRFGVAYAINDKTVVRGGFGIFYNRYVTSTIESFFTANGLYQQSFSLSSTQAAQLATGPVFPNILPSAAGLTPGTSSIAFPSAGFRNAYTEQANIAIERQITHDSSLSISYVWDRGLHFISARDLNAPNTDGSETYYILNTAGAITGSYTTPRYLFADKPYKSFGSVIQVDSGAKSWYSGLIVQYNKRFNSWFQGQAAYTYSHAIDDNIGGGGSVLYTPSFPTSVFNGNYSGEKGSASTDQRHRLTVNAVLAPKFTHGTSWAERYLINGWQLSLVSTFASAQPLVPVISTSSSTVDPALYSTSSLNGLGGSLRVPFESTSALNIDQLYRTDARLSKVFPITERLKVTLGFEAFNVFNHPFLEGTGPRVNTQYTTAKGTLNGASIYELVPFPTYGRGVQTQSTPDGTTARRAQALVRLDF